MHWVFCVMVFDIKMKTSGRVWGLIHSTVFKIFDHLINVQEWNSAVTTLNALFGMAKQTNQVICLPGITRKHLVYLTPTLAQI